MSQVSSQHLFYLFQISLRFLTRSVFLRATFLNLSEQISGPAQLLAKCGGEHRIAGTQPHLVTGEI